MQTNNDGWFPFAAIGLKIKKEDYQIMGFIGIRQTIECLFKNRIEFRSGDVSKHEAPVQARDLKAIGKQAEVTVIPSKVSEKTLRPK